MASEFKKITLQKFSSMRSRFRPKYAEDGETLKKPGRELPFTLERFRQWIRDQAVGDGLRCEYCGRLLKLKDVEIDHVVPVSRGGELGLENLVPACKQDNMTKGELTGEEYVALLKGLDTFPLAAKKDVLRRLRTAAMGARMRFHPREGKDRVAVAKNPTPKASKRNADGSFDLFVREQF